MKFLFVVGVFAQCLLLYAASGSNPTPDQLECPEICDCEYDSEFRHNKMNCSDRQLNAVPEGTFERIRRLLLNNNNIKELKNDAFNGFPYLTYLDLKDNVIEHVEKDAFRSLNFDNVDLSNNRIKHIDFNMLSTVVILDGNPLLLDAEITEEIPLAYMYPRAVSLENCGISRIGTNLEKKFFAMKHVSFSRNSIVDIAGAFSNTIGLQNVDLSYNKIKMIQGVDGLIGLSSLHWLNLTNNPLQYLDVESLKTHLTMYFRRLDISDTPLACECLYADIRTWASQRRIELQATCKGIDPCAFCSDGSVCVTPEFCCKSGKCSEDGKCGAAAMAVLPVALLLLVAATVL